MSFWRRWKKNWIGEQTEQKKPKTHPLLLNVERTNEKFWWVKLRTKKKFVRTEQSIKRVQKRKKSSSRGRRKLSLPLPRTNLSFKKRARARGESVFLVVGKYHLWYLTLTRTLVVVKEKEIARGARAFFARKAGALFSSGFFFPAEHRIRVC